ncbi:MAG: hypothetical protein ABI885_30885, partial [Gammaproteobacteria bacterium]
PVKRLMPVVGLGCPRIAQQIFGLRHRHPQRYRAAHPRRSAPADMVKPSPGVLTTITVGTARDYQLQKTAMWLQTFRDED